MAVRGSCLCNSVRYEVTGALGATGHCHCSMCRKWNGAAFGTWASVEPDEFRWSAGAELVQRYESSPGKQRCFCGKCGSPLVSVDSGRVTEVVLSSVDDEPGVRPDCHIFVGSKAIWYEIWDPLPRYEGWPPEPERRG